MKAVDGLKRCSKCGETKAVGAFCHNRCEPDGFGKQCKRCMGDAAKARYAANPNPVKQRAQAWLVANQERAKETHQAWYAANAERVKARVRARYAANPEEVGKSSRAWRDANPELAKLAEKRWVEANRKRITAGQKRWREQHPEAFREIQNRWQAANPENVRMGRRNRRARKLATGGKILGNEWVALVASYGNRCLCCGATDGLTLDHVQPIARGGAHNLSNAQPLCRSCNSRKGTQAWDYRPYPLPVALGPNFVCHRVVTI
jgi:hypothetical protein